MDRERDRRNMFAACVNERFTHTLAQTHTLTHTHLCGFKQNFNINSKININDKGHNTYMCVYLYIYLYNHPPLWGSSIISDGWRVRLLKLVLLMAGEKLRPHCDVTNQTDLNTTWLKTRETDRRRERQLKIQKQKAFSPFPFVFHRQTRGGETERVRQTERERRVGDRL